MRAVYAGTVDDAAGPRAVVLKRHHLDRRLRRWLGRLGAGRGPREGRVLAALEAAGVSAPRPLAWWAGAGEDVLVTAHVEGLRPLAPPDAWDAALLGALATLVARVHALGLTHRDWHAGNLALGPGGPCLVDLGGARLGPPRGAGARVAELARLDHGLLGGARRTQRWRALAAYATAAFGADPGAARALARRWAGPVARAAAAHARAYRRGRDRRAGRTGPHFEPLAPAAGVCGARHRDGTDAGWAPWLAALAGGAPPGAEPLAPGGRVLGAAGPGGRALALKRYPPAGPARAPRARRAFGLAHALENRRLPVARAHAWIAVRGGASWLVSERLPHPDLARWLAGPGAHAAPARRALLARVGRTLRALHDAALTHRDLKATNLVVAAGPAPSVWFVDLEGLARRRRPPGWRRRARDLARLDRSLCASRTDRLRVLRAYLAAGPRPPVPVGRLVAWIARRRAALRRRHEARYGPDAGPR